MEQTRTRSAARPPRSNADDRWTLPKAMAFLDALAECGKVAEAARAVGMSRQAAFRLRRRIAGTPLERGWELALHRGIALRAARRERRGWDDGGLAALLRDAQGDAFDTQGDASGAQGDGSPPQGGGFGARGGGFGARGVACGPQGAGLPGKVSEIADQGDGFGLDRVSGVNTARAGPRRDSAARGNYSPPPSSPADPTSE